MANHKQIHEELLKKHLFITMTLLVWASGCASKKLIHSPTQPLPSYYQTASATPAKSNKNAEKGQVIGITAAHNNVRKQLRLLDLVWSTELAEYAEQWANYLQQRGCSLAHRPVSGRFKQQYGENLFAIGGARANSNEVVQAWVSERKFYNYRTNRCNGVCGHYTQIVWQQTRRLGCAVRSCGHSEVWVCNYDPPGNVLGQKPYK